MLRRRRTSLAALIAMTLAATPTAFAWGATGHELLTRAALERLSSDLPAFLRKTEVRAQIELVGREPDRWRGAGRVHDAERDPGHFIDLGDDGLVEGLFPLNGLPATRADFDAQMRAKGINPPAPGYLPYAMIDGWQQVVKDFAYWRASKVAAQTAKSKSDRDWFAADLKLRETLLIRDIGVWSHYVADGSQPQHVTDHYAGWDKYPDPMTYPPPGLGPEVKSVHNYFEGAFVKQNFSLRDVENAMSPERDCGCPIETRVADYLTMTHTQVVPLYEMVSAGGLKDATPAAIAFTRARLAAGASEIRDELEAAWRASATATVGYPAINVADIESGRTVLTRDSYGAD
ncbi:MAG: S1/P1 Nuclease [Alphaproteobacteria bacterium]|nr:S1/P1 Nuclease [Alphaproteobacteria bacterium]